jgi:hypothetical protein
MNSGIQDALNLAWKLALVCQGHCGAELLDSYEAERRPVAEMITRSGDAAEHSHTLTDPAERRLRDEALRAVFADSTLRHQEVIAEAELDIDYGDSPIVMGDSDAALRPGQRLPDTIPARLTSGEEYLLHDLTNRVGHTALLIIDPSARGGALAQVSSLVGSSSPTALIESTIEVTARLDGDEPQAGRGPNAADPAVDGITLLAVRPDGYIGLRADRHHLEALTAYQSILGWCPR